MMFDYRTLWLAWKEASRGKHSAPNQAQYLYELEERLYSLQYRLETHTFQPSPLRSKNIYIPKRRVAQVPSLEDKIVQHAICDFYAYDALTKPLIKETSACIQGRGAAYATDLFTQQLRRFWRTKHCKPYILKCDIHSYFASIPHDRLHKLVDRYIFDEDVKRIMLQFINMTNIGLPLGLQQSQLLANLNLSELDHKIKEQSHMRFYGRYMDDFYIMSDSKDELQILWKWIDTYIQSIGLELNPKTDIFYNDIDFLGFHFHLTDTGKVIMRIKNSKKKTQKNYLRLLTRKIHEQKITPEMAASSYEGWRAHALRGNCRNMVLAMDKRFNGYLNEIGYELIIYKKRVMICQEQSQS